MEHESAHQGGSFDPPSIVHSTRGAYAVSVLTPGRPYPPRILVSLNYVPGTIPGAFLSIALDGKRVTVLRAQLRFRSRSSRHRAQLDVCIDPDGPQHIWVPNERIDPAHYLNDAAKLWQWWQEFIAESDHRVSGRPKGRRRGDYEQKAPDIVRLHDHEGRSWGFIAAGQGITDKTARAWYEQWKTEQS